MTQEQGKQVAKSYLRSYLQERGINPNANFKCLAGTHTDNNPSMGYDQKNERIHCFSCNESMDIFDLISLDTGLQGKELFVHVYKKYGIQVDNENNGGSGPETVQKRYESSTKPQEKDFSYRFNQWHDHITDTDYPARRGLSSPVIERFNLGYCESFKGNKEGEIWKGALIIPTGKSSFCARNTDPTAEKTSRYKKVGPYGLFNSEALYNREKPVFIVEGEIDALSIIEAGGEALAIASASKAMDLCKTVKQNKNRISQPLILALDNDEAGNRARAEITATLQDEKIKYYEFNVAGAYKDPNEALLSDRSVFCEKISQITSDPDRYREEVEKEAYLQTSTAYGLQNFITDLEQKTKATCYSTGFPTLDKKLDGGLYAGLYVIGAISSLGKTTLALQIADNIAKAGNDVLIFSLEMAREELIAKSLSRITLYDSLKNRDSFFDAQTTRSILSGKDLNTQKARILQSAVSQYYEYAKQIYIHIGIGDIGTEKIRKVVDQHIRVTGRKPVVFIDYLQILALPEDRLTDKQATDKNILELKRISRDYGIAVFGISSFNRENYTEPVNLSSFKESGAIEYSSDVLMALQFTGMDYEPEETEKKRLVRIRELLKEQRSKGKSAPRDIQLKILKNRNGSVDFDGTELKFYSAFNCFSEERLSGKEETENDSDEYKVVQSKYGK